MEVIKKHGDYEKSLEAQGEKMNALDQFGQKLLAAGHYESVAVASRRDAVLQRCVHVCVCMYVCL